MEFDDYPHGDIYSRATSITTGILSDRSFCARGGVMPRTTSAGKRNTYAPARAVYLRNARAIIEQNAGGAFRFYRTWLIGPNSAIVKHKLVVSEASVFVLDWRKVPKPW